MHSCIRIPSVFPGFVQSERQHSWNFLENRRGVNTPQLADQCRRCICFPESDRTIMRRCIDMEQRHSFVSIEPTRIPDSHRCCLREHTPHTRCHIWIPPQMQAKS